MFAAQHARDPESIQQTFVQLEAEPLVPLDFSCYKELKVGHFKTIYGFSHMGFSGHWINSWTCSKAFCGRNEAVSAALGKVCPGLEFQLPHRCMRF
jgi:hypothetical protein